MHGFINVHVISIYLIESCVWMLVRSNLFRWGSFMYAMFSHSFTIHAHHMVLHEHLRIHNGMLPSKVFIVCVNVGECKVLCMHVHDLRRFAICLVSTLWCIFLKAFEIVVACG